MDYNIILNALRESVDYIKKLDDIRGELNENLEPINTFEDVDFERDFRDADMFLNFGYLSLKIFESGFNEFMGSENTAKFEKKYLLSQILIISRSCDNLHPSLYNDEIISLNYFDEKTGFDEDWREIDGEFVWCIPDLEDYKNAFPDNRVLHIYYKYSYYIISIAKIISEVVNNYLELTNSRYIYYYLSERRTKFHFMSLKHFNPIEAMYISDVYNEYHDYIRNGNVSYERSYSFGNFFLKYLNYEKLEDENNINENLDAIPFKNPKSEEYYNKIVEIFELEKVFKDTEENKNYFNLLEFKFKVYNEEGVGIYNLEQAYEICKDLSLILGKANAIKVFESCYQLNPNSQNIVSDDNSNFDIESEENINDPHKDKYNDIFKLLNDSITYASHEKIGKIIQYKIKKTYDINTSINPTYSKSYFCLSSKVIINAAKIGMCFELNNNEIRHFIRLLGENNTKKQITGRIPKEDKLNARYDLDSILITIRNEYLHEIDPKVFPII